MKCSNTIIPGYEDTSKIKNPGLEMKIKYDMRKSGETQVPTTVGTYRKVKAKYFPSVKSTDILDYGAGMGVASAEMGFDSLEPNASGWTPKYTDASQIKKKYKGIISNAVLNVIPNDMAQRDGVVQDIGNKLAVGGKAFINVRALKGDVDKAKNPTPFDDGHITAGKGTFQKGFNKPELVEYLQDILGGGFVVTKSPLGTVGALITKVKEVKVGDIETAKVFSKPGEMTIMLPGAGDIVLEKGGKYESIDGEWSVDTVGLSDKVKGKGLGVKLYLKAVEELLKMGEYRASYLSSGGMTTESAMRVWRSLYRNKEKHLKDFPQLRGAFAMFNNERGMIVHDNGPKEEWQYEQDIGSEPAYSIELYPDVYAKNVSRLSKRKGALDELPYFKADETQAPATAGSYEDTGVYYHGSSSATNIEGDWSTSDANIYGSGFYTTTSKEVAQSYTKKGRGSEPTVYRIKEINKGPSKNLETTPAKLYGRGLLDEYVELEGKSLIEALNEFRNDSSDFSLTRTDVIEIIDAVFDRLASKGYTSVTHHGGALTGNKTKHLVKIFLRPTRDIRLIKQ